MAFDDSTGGIDRAQYSNTHDLWGDSQGDRSVPSLWDSMETSREFSRMARAEYEAWLARQARKAARLDADAQRRRSAPVEAKIKADRLRNAKTNMGAAFREAYAKQADGKARK